MRIISTIVFLLPFLPGDSLIMMSIFPWLDINLHVIRQLIYESKLFIFTLHALFGKGRQVTHNRYVKRKLSISALALFLLVTGVSCTTPSPEEIEEMAGQQYFGIHIAAVEELNYYQGEPSSLSLCVYQLTDRRGFDSLRDDPDCLETLMLCEKFDDTVVGRERLFVNPGEFRTFDFERRRGVKYLAFAAGYHNSTISGSTLLVELPPVTARSRGSQPPIVGVTLECDRMLRDKSSR